MDQSVDQSIERVIHDLRPRTAFDARYDPPQSLYDRLKRHHTPGAGIAVVNNYGIEWTRGFGLCEAGKPDRVTPETLFQAASISKVVFALAIMCLVQEKLLDLDEDVNAYLKSWRFPANGDWQPRITLRQLLSHTAGLTVHGFAGYQRLEPLPTLIQILDGSPPANNRKVEVNILPGLQCQYSGGGTIVAQQVMVDVVGEPFPEIMRRVVLEPLGMANSTFQQPLPRDCAQKAAVAHPWWGIPLRGKCHIYPELAAAGLWTTATDLARVGVELLNVLRGQPSNLLAKETIEVMLSPQLPGQKVGEGEFIGLEFFCNGAGESFHFGHPGWNEGFMAIMRFYRNQGKGAVIMLNSNEGFPLFEEIFCAIAREYGWPDVPPRERTPVRLPQPHIYAGEYIAKAGVKLWITIRDGIVMLTLMHQPSLELMPLSEIEFIAKEVNTKIIFEKEDHTITALTVNQAGRQLRAIRSFPAGSAACLTRGETKR